MAELQPIIVKKIKKGGHGHHGGAWKLAYADFVTAMMAFFLLMWLLGTTDAATRKGISEYFNDPYKASLEGGKDVGARTSLMDAGGSDMITQDSGQDQNGATEDSQPTPEEIQEQMEKLDQAKLEELKEKIEKMINDNENLNEFKEQIKLETTPEGLRVQIIDNKNQPMFRLASSETEPYVKTILQQLAPVINELPNKISVNGHTDSRPFPANQTGYTNWELSSDRANAARQELIKGSLAEDKILRVTGLSSSIPYNPKDPMDPMNRRISIIVMNKKTENMVLEEAGTEVKVTEIHEEVQKHKE